MHNRPPDIIKEDWMGYRGNDFVKGHNVKHGFTQEQLDEYNKCKNDPVYFCTTYLQVIHPDHGLVPFTLYDYQEEMIRHLNGNRFSVFKCARQVGKSTVTCGYLLWMILFHPDKKVGVIANKGSIARELLARMTLMLESVPFYLQPGCKALNKGSIYFSNESSVKAYSTSSSSVRGESFSAILLDEFAFVQRANEFFTSTFPTISAGKTTKIMVVSTPNGVGNPYHKIWEGAVQGTSDFKPFSIHWSDVPGRDEEWKRQTIANTSERQFAQEHEGEFHGSADTLIDTNCLLGLKAQSPIRIKDRVRIYEEPAEGHQYVMTVDVCKGRGQDYSTFTIFDCTDTQFVQVATFKDNLISPLLFPNVLAKFGTYYNEAIIVVESNGPGEVVCNGLHYDIEYENLFVESFVKRGGIGVNMSKTVKRIGTSNFKDILESGRLKVVDEDSILEISTFQAKGSSYAAAPGCHDDLVMNLVMFAWFVSTEAFGDISQVDLKELLYSEKIAAMEADVLDCQLYHSNGLDDEETVLSDPDISYGW